MRSNVHPARPMALAAMAVAMAVSVSGCELIGYALGTSPIGGPIFGEATPYPSFDVGPFTEGSFATGSATISVNGAEPVTLELAAESGEIVPGILIVQWSEPFEKPDAWILSLEPNERFEPYDGTPATAPVLQIIQQQGADFWSLDAAACVLVIEAYGTDGVLGSATCTGAVWTDPFETDPRGNPRPVVGVPPVDLGVTFEARP